MRYKARCFTYEHSFCRPFSKLQLVKCAFCIWEGLTVWNIHPFLPPCNHIAIKTLAVVTTARYPRNLFLFFFFKLCASVPLLLRCHPSVTCLRAYCYVRMALSLMLTAFRTIRHIESVNHFSQFLIVVVIATFRTLLTFRRLMSTIVDVPHR